MGDLTHWCKMDLAKGELILELEGMEENARPVIIEESYSLSRGTMNGRMALSKVYNQQFDLI